MSRATFKVNTSDISDMATGLSQAKSNLDGLKKFAEAAAEAVGHADLAKVVRDFGTNWDRRREDLTESIGDLADAAGRVTTDLESLDDDLAKNVPDNGQ